MINKIVLPLIILLFLNCNNNLNNEEGFLTIKDSKIHYKISGKGKPIILLHGGLLNLDSWDYQVTDLNNKGFKTIRYSELGHGKTENGKEVLKGVEIIDEFIKRKCNDEKVTIIGLSWGGVLATDYTLKNSTKVENLILVSPGINGWDWFSFESTKSKYEKLGEAYMTNDSSKVGQLSYQYWIIGPQRKESEMDLEVRRNLKKMIDDNISLNWGKSKSQIDTISSIDRLNEIKTPTLILLGEKDESDIFAIGKLYENGIQNAKMVTLKDVGHSLNAENPKEFNKTVLDFLKK